MAWLNESNETKGLAHTFKRASSGKGWIIETEKFDCFIWNSDKLLQQLLTALATWVDSGQGKSLMVTKDTKQKRGYVVEPVLDKNKKPVVERWFLTQNGYSCTEESAEAEINPFL